LPTAAAYGNDEQVTLLHEFKHDLNLYLGAHGQAGQPATLEELIAFNQAHQAEVMPYFGQQLFVAAQATTGLDAPEYLTAKERARRTTREQGIVAVMTAENLSALISPSSTPAWMTNYATGDPGIGVASGPAAVAGCPHLSVPMGKINGLPVGLSIFAGPWQDGTVLALGHAYEKLPR
jgi:amidase